MNMVPDSGTRRNTEKVFKGDLPFWLILDHIFIQTFRFVIPLDMRQNSAQAEECPACSALLSDIQPRALQVGGLNSAKVSVLRRYMEAVRTLLQPFEAGNFKC